MKSRVGFLLLAFFLIYASGRTQIGTPNLEDPLSSAFFMRNRDSVRAMMVPKSCGVFFSGGYQPFEADLTQAPQFFALPDFYYLTGRRLPESVLVLFPEPFMFEGKPCLELLFADEDDDFAMISQRSGVKVVMDLKQWRNFCINQLSGSEFKKIHSVFSPFLDDLGWAPSAQRALLADFNSAVYPGLIFDGRSQGLYQKILSSEDKDWDRTLAGIGAFVEYFPRLRRDPILDRALRVTGAEDLAALKKYISGIRLDVVTVEKGVRRLRNQKTPAEISLLRRLTQLNIAALKEGIRYCGPNQPEYGVNAAMNWVIQVGGGTPAVPTHTALGQPLIPAHPRWQPHPLKEGEVRVLDAGVKLKGYQSRLTRTVPVSGSFSDDQKKVYSFLVNTQQAVIAACKPGTVISELTEIYDQELERPLIKAGVAKNAKSLSRIRRLEGYHPIGLEQVDNTDYSPLVPGMVIVVETGIYFNDHPETNPKWKGTAYELRDMVVITPTGSEWISRELPIHASEIEALVKASSKFE